MKHDPRSIIKDVLKKNLLGPANDTFIDCGTEEITNEYPLQKYYTGIIFPRFLEHSSDSETVNQVDIDFEDYPLFSHEKTDLDLNDMIETTETEIVPDIDDSGEFFRKELYQNTFGMSFCVRIDCSSITVKLEYGRYRRIDPVQELVSEYRIELGLEDYCLIRHLNANNDNYLESMLGYDNVTNSVYLCRKLIGNSTGEATGDFADFRTIKRVVFDRITSSKGSELERYKRINSILRIITPLFKLGWIRSQHRSSYVIKLSELLEKKRIIIDHKAEDNDQFAIGLHVLMIQRSNTHAVIKVLVENRSKIDITPVSLHRNPIVNSLCMFQSQIIVSNEFIQAMPKNQLSPTSSMEDKIIDCQYRNTSVYGLGHNCACIWEHKSTNETTVKTEFMPTVRTSVSTNIMTEEAKAALNIKENSCFGSHDDYQLIEHLENFADDYCKWIADQDIILKEIKSTYIEPALMITKEQKYILLRIYSGIEILKTNSEFLKLYRLANSAMYINMVKSKTNDYDIDFHKSETLYYHAFQLAFLLINLECVIDSRNKQRSQGIDLIWFPTGGGKTEAYFLLSMYSLLFRKYKHGASGRGTSVIIRYTLRLLTAQQFQRASKMILSLNYACSLFMPSQIEDGLYTIGLWIGSASSPNKLHDADDSAAVQNSEIIEEPSKEDALRKNKFPISECPWCGHSLIDCGKTGFHCSPTKFEIKCLNGMCHFHKELPIDIVDESMYNNPPSLLFATIDKFARLAWVKKASSFFGSGDDTRPPDLIIQDELHLISGPLGSITALFEGMVEFLCCKDGASPRIIASTATIKNATAQVSALFGNREVHTFPPPGLGFDDNYFSKIDDKNTHREYVGVLPTGKTFTTTQVRLIALMLYSRMELIGKIDEKIDNYWTVVAYYNSLRELGRMFGKTRDEIKQAYLNLVYKKNRFGDGYWMNNPKELTSRLSGYDIKNVLQSLQNTNIYEDDFQGSLRNAIDLVFATNMISVGLDISRLNLIIMNGQPKNVSEYIQVTSRIARSHPGLVISVYNPFKVRDKSHFESFAPFHSSYYRFVEPISVTPYTRVAIAKMLPTILAVYLRMVKGIEFPCEVSNSMFEELLDFMKRRMQDDEIAKFFEHRMHEHIEYLQDRLSQNPDLSFDDLLHSINDATSTDDLVGDWLTMNSMREISPNAVIKLFTPKKRKKGSCYE